MKKLLIAAFLVCGIQTMTTPVLADVQVTEALDRGLVAIKTSKGTMVQWRILPSDIEKETTFSLWGANSETGLFTAVKSFAAGSASCYLDTKNYAFYQLRIEEPEGEGNSTVVPVKASQLTQIKLDRPAATSDATYTPNDASVGDVDGDGQYELILKWDPSNSKDNSQTGKTANVYFDCYEITGPDAGKKLWRIDMGMNIRAGAHYSPFLVYDFDGDGKAEFVLKTGPATKDASGTFVSEYGANAEIKAITTNAKDCRNGNGHVTSGEEFLTVFNGATGVAMQTVWYNPNRGGTCGGAATYGTWESVAGKSTNYNRGERYNACVAYLDGLDKLPSIVMQRGYYTLAYFWAVDWDGTNLKTRWLHRGLTKSSWNVVDGNGKQVASGSGKSSYGQGVHGISVGDVDDDGFDEIVMGSATIDHDGRLLCSTGFGHGDAIHLGKILPDRKGLQIYMPHEESSCNYGDDLHDAATGEVLYRGTTTGDNGRGLACDMFYSIDASTGLDKYRGWEMWSGAMSNPLNAVSSATVGSKPDTNFRIYWNGDLYDESFDGRFSSGDNTCAPRIVYWDGASKKTITLSTYGGKPMSCNTTKATPCLTADIWGDWREEIVMWDGNDPSLLDIYTTVESTIYPVPCLMTDHVYRMGVAWQNSSYNQPPHLGYYLPDAFLASYSPVTLPEKVTVNTEIVPISIPVKGVKTISTSGTVFSLGLEVDFDTVAQTINLSGILPITGKFTGKILMKGPYNTATNSFTLQVVEAEPSNLTGVVEQKTDVQIYDLCGQKVTRPIKGQIYIVNGRKTLY